MGASKSGNGKATASRRRPLSAKEEKMQQSFIKKYGDLMSSMSPNQIAAMEPEFKAEYKKVYGHEYDRYPPTEFLKKVDLSHFLGQQESHAVKSLWRIGASVTAFELEDPDPAAIDKGAMLGIQFEMMRLGRFTTAYRVFLNREFGTRGFDRPFTVPQSYEDEGSYLRVHRHTMPIGIPIAALAQKWLPEPHNGFAEGKNIRLQQDLAMFVRELRQHLVAYHNRQARVADVRRMAGIGRKRKRPPVEEEGGSDDSHDVCHGADCTLDGCSCECHQDKGLDSDDADAHFNMGKIQNLMRKPIRDVKITDAEAKSLEVALGDRDTARMLINDFGEVEKIIGDKLTRNEVDMYRQFVQQFKTPQELQKAMKESWKFCKDFAGVIENNRRGNGRR
jgi:central kinetochore subunit Mal2/MCM21